MQEIFLSDRSQKIDTSAIRKVFDLAQKISNPINLSIGQPDFPIPQEVKESITRAIFDNKTNYSPTKGILPLREAIAKQHFQQYNYEYQSNNILISNGTANILFLLFQVLFDPQDVIIIIEPYFLTYNSLAQYNNMQIEYLNENFSVNEIEMIYKKYEKKNKKPKAILFSSPSNPTGKILSKKQIYMISQYAEKYNTLIISDEIYKEYDYENNFCSPAEIFPKNSIILNGFSKSHSMTGLRVGYIITSNSFSSIIDNIANLQQYSSVCSPTPAQWGATTAIGISVQPIIQKMKKRRDLILSYFNNETTFSYPNGAFYIFPKVSIPCIEFVQKAIQQKLLIVPGNIFERNNNHIRISYAQDEKILRKGMEILISIFNDK